MYSTYHFRPVFKYYSCALCTNFLQLRIHVLFSLVGKSISVFFSQVSLVTSEPISSDDFVHINDDITTAEVLTDEDIAALTQNENSDDAQDYNK